MNRKQRRTQNATSNVKSADDVPMARPPTSTPKAKTLLEIAAERQAQLAPEDRPFARAPRAEDIVHVKVDAEGRIVPQIEGQGLGLGFGDGEAVAEPIPPFLDTALTAVSLSAIHFTLEVLTVHQYAQELLFGPIFFHTLCIALPTLFFLIHLFHGHLLALKVSRRTKDVVYAMRQVLFVGIANVAGCYLIQVTNDKGYYAVMKRAPGIGTVWVWCVLELGLAGALAGVVGPGVYAWWYGYGIW